MADSAGKEAVLQKDLEANLRRVVGDGALVTQPGALLTYEADALMAHRRKPAAVVMPGTSGQVAEVVNLLRQAGVPFVARGAGTGLAGGALAASGGVVVSLTRMNRILELDPPGRRARVEAGVLNAALNQAAAPYGLHFAPDPSSQTACTLGGNVAVNAGGPHCLKYGVTSNHVTSLQVVLPDGRLVELNGSQAGGYDLAGLFVGSEGTFGIAVQLELALTPLAPAVETLLAMFDDVRDGGRAVSAIIAAGLLPAAMEILDGPTIRAVEQSVYAAGYPLDVQAALVVEFDGAASGLPQDAELARDLCLEYGARDVRLARDAGQRERLWQARKSAYGAMGRVAPDLVLQDAVVPRSRLPDILDVIYAAGRRHQLRICSVFHAGDGNIHPCIMFDRRDAEESRRVELVSRRIMEACIEAGGSITGEHGVGLDKRDYMELVFPDDVLHLMNAVRRVFDPFHLSNPGKILPARILEGDDRVTGQEARDSEGEAQLPGREADVPGEEMPGARQEARDSRQEAGHPGKEASSPHHRGGSPGQPAVVTEEGGRRGIVEEVGRLLGPEAVRTGQGARRWGLHGKVPAAVALPATVEQAAAVLAQASSRGWATELVGSCCGVSLYERKPAAVDLVVSAERFAGLVSHEPADLTASVEAGTPRAALRQELSRAGQWLPLDSPGGPGSTLGGTVASAMAGPLQAGYGTPRDHVTGIQFITGDGRAMELGGRVVKNVAGYDLVKLLVGSHGTLGLITRLHVRLRALPARDRTVLLTGASPAPLLAEAGVWAGSGLEPVALELLSPGLAHKCGAASGEWALLARLHGNHAAVSAAVDLALAGSRWKALPESRAAAVWDGLATAESGAGVLVRLVGRRPELESALELAQHLAGLDPRIWLAAHAAAGVVRILAPAERVLANTGRWSRELAAARTALTGVAGGGLLLSRAPVPLLETLDPVGEGAALSRQLAGQLRRVFDPAGILAPGRDWC